MTEHEKIQQMVQQKDQAPLTLEPAKSALLIIDTQRYFARPDYPFGKVFEKLAPGAAEGYYKRVKATVLPNIRRLQACFRSHRLPVIFCGAGCYLPAARELADRGFRVLVAEDACTELSEEMHRSALFTFSYVFGRVKTTTDTIGFLDRTSAAAR